LEIAAVKFCIKDTKQCRQFYELGAQERIGFAFYISSATVFEKKWILSFELTEEYAHGRITRHLNGLYGNLVKCMRQLILFG
jgi:hypothetical protein